MLETLKQSKSADRFNARDLGNIDICDLKVVSDEGDKVGKVEDYVNDDKGRLRYIIVDTGNWFIGKSILVPVGMVNIDDQKREVLLTGLSKEQVKSMPPYDKNQPLDENYESEVLESYYPGFRQKGEFANKAVDYDQLDKFETPERIRLIEERLMVNKHPEKMGDVHVRKTVETHMETVEVPVTEEHLVIERHPVGEAQGIEGESLSSGTIGAEEFIDIPLYREEVDVSKRAVASEEVTLRKEKRTNTRTVKEEVRKERLDIDNPGKIDIDTKNT